MRIALIVAALAIALRGSTGVEPAATPAARGVVAPADAPVHLPASLPPGIAPPPASAVAAVAPPLIAPVLATGSARTFPGSCPHSAQEKPCLVRLHGPGAPSLSPECTDSARSGLLAFPQPGRVTDSNADGWWETVIEVGLDATTGCGCASFRVHFEEPVRQWVLNIGDSPTNNGHGGDAGTTFHEAETEIRTRTIAVYSASRRPGVNTVDKLLELELPPLAGRFADLEVRDQSLAFSMPEGAAGGPVRWKVQTPDSGLLYDLFPHGAAEGTLGSRQRSAGIFASFNRVIHDRSGAPEPASRVGTGVSRVEVRLTP